MGGGKRRPWFAYRRNVGALAGQCSELTPFSRHGDKTGLTRVCRARSGSVTFVTTSGTVGWVGTFKVGFSYGTFSSVPFYR